VAGAGDTLPSPSSPGNRAVPVVHPRSSVRVDVVAPPVPAHRPGVVVGGVVVVGVALRLFAFGRNPSLWIDEAMLALNVVGRDFAGLFAPVGYLLVAKLCHVLGGSSEFALRLPSLLASLTSLALFVPLAFRALPAMPARYAVAMFSLSPYLIGYAGEFKQYELDACVCVGLLALGRSNVARGWLALAGSLAVWFSHPALFVLGGLGLSILSKRTIPVVAAWAVSFLACYVFVLRGTAGNDYLRTYWAGKFLTLPPTGPGDVAWVGHHFFELFANPGGFGNAEFALAGVAGLCFLIGCVAWWREDRRLLIAVVGPLLLCLLASGLKMYPFAGRLMVFAVPLLILGVSRGLGVLSELLNTWRPRAGYLAVGVLFLGPLVECGKLLKRPMHDEDVRGAVHVLAETVEPGDRVLIPPGSEPAFRYYNADRVPAEFAEPCPGGRQVWVLVAHRKPGDVDRIRANMPGYTANTAWTSGDAVIVRLDR
jgi:hypothetical protein